MSIIYLDTDTPSTVNFSLCYRYWTLEVDRWNHCESHNFSNSNVHCTISGKCRDIFHCNYVFRHDAFWFPTWSTLISSLLAVLVEQTLGNSIFNAYYLRPHYFKGDLSFDKILKCIMFNHIWLTHQPSLLITDRTSDKIIRL